MPAPEPNSTARLDKWLWAARLFKTRSLSVEAIGKGRVEVNGKRGKPGQAVRPGDAMVIRKPPFEWQIEVQAVSSVRGPAKQAALLYQESAGSITARDELAAQLKAEAVNRPKTNWNTLTRKQRRQLDELRGRRR